MGDLMSVRANLIYVMHHEHKVSDFFSGKTLF